MFTFDQLDSFIAVAEELHFGRAAERLHITQPSLSRQIQKLEKTVGAELLNRGSRKVELTAAGTMVLGEARRLVTLADRVPVTAKQIAAGSSGLLRIGFTATSGFSILGPMLEQISAALPDVDIDLQELLSIEQLDGLRTGELDLGIARPLYEPEIFDSRLLYREAMMVAVPTGHPLTGLTRDVAAKDIAGEPLIMYSFAKSRYFYDIVARMLPTINRNISHTVGQTVTMVSLVAAKRGLAFVPQSAMLLGLQGVEFLPFASSDPEPVELHAIWNRSNINPALIRVVRSLEYKTRATDAPERQTE
ncbi:LysR family transcriptional regulator [Pseudarthrobacter sp. DSP2-3-2b1]|uniref:LysR family transcriptional regulator n=1 Tax=Pseudarthrobacter sp. DSP2-3-2b1 TaxID=2804661 RepID=UPI003CF497CB